MYPSRTQYRNSVMNQLYPVEENGGYCFSAILMNNEPIVSAGGSATVFKVTNQSGTIFALKLFSREIEGRFERLRTISSYLENSKHNFFTHFVFIENLIFVEIPGAKDEDCYFPGVIMKWIEADTLESRLKELVISNKVKEIRQIAENFKEIAIKLLDEGIAHGDLKLSNILIDDNLNLILIDYDGMFVPALNGQRSIENGTASYQHIKRTEDDFNENIDHFSILNIYTSLMALSVNPDLYTKYNDGDNILFTKADFITPDKSKLFSELSKLNETKGLVFYLKQSLNSDNIYIDNIKDLLNGKFPKPHLSITHKPEKVLIGDLVKISWSAENVSFVKINGVDYFKVNSIEEVVTKNQKFQFEYGNDLETIKQDYKIDTIPKPEIRSFSTNHVALKFDEKLELKWDAKNFKTAYLKYNQIQIDVSNVNRYTIEGLTKNLQVSLELTSLINNQKVSESINVEVYYPVSLKVSQEKKITFPNRSVKLLIDTENAQKVTLSPLNIDLTGKKEYDLKTDKDISFVIVAENKRYNVAHKSEIEILKAPAYTKKVIELPKIELKIPSPQIMKIPSENLINNLSKHELFSMKFNKIMDKFNIFKIRYKNHLTK